MFSTHFIPPPSFDACRARPSKLPDLMFAGHGPVKVWLSEFSFLRFRTDNQHSQCQQCIKHKTMLKALGRHMVARAKQLSLYHDHLRAQYADRCLYWEARGLSRLRGHTITLIADGMDQAKFEIPRAAVMKGKDFSTFQKPRVHVACIICHGRCIIYFISNPNTKKDGNATTEMLSFALGVLRRQGVHLPSTSLILQHDNTCREFKNHNGLRWCVSQVSAGNLARITCQFLRSGHTHEDIDQQFGRLGKFMQKFRDIQTPNDIAEIIRQHLDVSKLPFETERIVVQMDTVRDWTLGHSEFIFFRCNLIKIVTFSSFWFQTPFLTQTNQPIRTGYHAAAVPFNLKGLGGPGAPHYFSFERRADAGALFFIQSNLWCNV